MISPYRTVGARGTQKKADAESYAASAFWTSKKLLVYAFSSMSTPAGKSRCISASIV
jgi:hypothetical protein